MADKDDELLRLTRLYDEAAALHGPDWSRMEAHVRQQIRALPDPEQVALQEAIERALRFEPPHPTRH